MKYFAVLFITAIAATTLVSSSAVHKKEERQSCDIKRLSQLFHAFANCTEATAPSCASSGGVCNCCRSALASGNTGTSVYNCCVTLQDLFAQEAACAIQAGRPNPATIRICNLEGGVATSTDGATTSTDGATTSTGGTATSTLSYFTGLLLLLTAVTYQFLF